MFNDRHDDCEELMDSFNDAMMNCNRYQRLYRGDEIHRGKYGYCDKEIAKFLAEHKVSKVTNRGSESFYMEVDLFYRKNFLDLLKEVQNTKFFYVCNYKGEAEGQEVMIEEDAMKLPEFNDDF